MDELHEDLLNAINTLGGDIVSLKEALVGSFAIDKKSIETTEEGTKLSKEEKKQRSDELKEIKKLDTTLTKTIRDLTQSSIKLVKLLEPIARKTAKIEPTAQVPGVAPTPTGTPPITGTGAAIGPDAPAWLIDLMGAGMVRWWEAALKSASREEHKETLAPRKEGEVKTPDGTPPQRAETVEPVTGAETVEPVTVLATETSVLPEPPPAIGDPTAGMVGATEVRDLVNRLGMPGVTPDRPDEDRPTLAFVKDDLPDRARQSGLHPDDPGLFGTPPGPPITPKGVPDKDPDDDEKKEPRLRDRLLAMLNKSIIGLAKGMWALTKAMGSMILKLLTSGLQDFMKFEEIGAQFNRSLEKNFVASEKLSKDMAGTGDLVTASENFAFRLQAGNVGMDANTKGLHKMLKATMKSGEDMKRLMGGMRSATAGIAGVDMESLTTAIDKNVGALRLTRTQLVEAMQTLSQNMLKWQSVLGTQGFQEASMALAGLTKDKSLYQQLLKNMEDLMSPGGLMKSITLGIQDVRMRTMRAQGPGAARDVIAATLEGVLRGAQRAQQFGAPGAGGGPVLPTTQLIMKAFEDAGVVELSNIRLAEAILAEAKKLQLTSEGQQMTATEISQTIADNLAEAQAQEEEFGNTLESLKKEILVPFINVAGHLALNIHKFLKENMGQLKDFAAKVAQVIGLVIESIFKILGKLGDLANLLPAAAGVAVGVPLAIKGAAVGGTLGGMAAGATIGSALPGIGTLIGGLIGAGIGWATYKALDAAPGTGSMSGDTGIRESWDKLLNDFNRFAEDEEQTRADEASAADDLAEMNARQKRDEDKGYMNKLLKDLDGFARFQVKQMSVADANLKYSNGQLVKIAEAVEETKRNTGDINLKTPEDKPKIPPLPRIDPGTTDRDLGIGRFK